MTSRAAALYPLLNAYRQGSIDVGRLPAWTPLVFDVGLGELLGKIEDERPGEKCPKPTPNVAQHNATLAELGA